MLILKLDRSLQRNNPMVEFLRSGAIVCMGLVVLGAGVVVVFYG
jgi:hypothetical protein